MLGITPATVNLKDDMNAVPELDQDRAFANEAIEPGMPDGGDERLSDKHLLMPVPFDLCSFFL